MDSKKKLRVIRQGVANLYKQLELLRAKITKLESAHTNMCKIKWALEEEILWGAKKTFKVSHRPKKKPASELNISELFAMLTSEQRKELRAKLQLK